MDLLRIVSLTSFNSVQKRSQVRPIRLTSGATSDLRTQQH